MEEEKAVRISKVVVKQLVHSSSGIVLNDKAAEALANILEGKAREIAAHAVANARKHNRSTILEEDVENYAVTRRD